MRHSFLSRLTGLTDPLREKGSKLHKLKDVMMIREVDPRIFVHGNETRLRRYLELPNGTPSQPGSLSHGKAQQGQCGFTFRRVIRPDHHLPTPNCLVRKTGEATTPAPESKLSPSRPCWVGCALCYLCVTSAVNTERAAGNSKKGHRPITRPMDLSCVDPMLFGTE